MFFKKYLTIVVFFLLLIWWPINHQSAQWPFFRIFYLLIIPLIVWISISLVWKKYTPPFKIEVILEKCLTSLICVIILFYAIKKGLNNSYLANTKTVRTFDGTEDVGDYVRVQGTDWGTIILLVTIALLIFWFGVIKRTVKKN